jgi:hypothetical protein
MTETVHEFVNRHYGDGFNRKFENICHRFMFEEAELDKRIAAKRELLDELTDMTMSIQKGLKVAEQIRNQLEAARLTLAEMEDKCNSF